MRRSHRSRSGLLCPHARSCDNPIARAPGFYAPLPGSRSGLLCPHTSPRRKPGDLPGSCDTACRSQPAEKRRRRGELTDAAAFVDGLEGRIAATKSALELAHHLGTQVVLNHIGDVPPPPADAAADPKHEPDPRWRLLIDVLTDLGTWGQRVGATLCAEAGRSGPDELVRVIASLPEGAISCDLVTGALVVHGHDPVEAVEQLSGHIGYVHATDAIAGAFAGRGRATPLGMGHVDLAAVFGTLEERGYLGWIGLEPVDARGGIGELAAAAAFLRGL
ncbi:MAG: sugar phosphate isomerase/epimerase family protein [Planctomycetia bacterium]